MPIYFSYQKYHVSLYYIKNYILSIYSVYIIKGNNSAILAERDRIQPNAKTGGENADSSILLRQIGENMTQIYKSENNFRKKFDKLLQKSKE